MADEANYIYLLSDSVESILPCEHLRIDDVHPYKKSDLPGIILSNRYILQSRLSSFERQKNALHQASTHERG